MTDSLPFDVLMEILPWIEYKDLPALASSSKAMSILALDRLYASIPAQCFLGAGTSICNNPTLAQRVLSLEVNRKHNGKNSDIVIPLLSNVLNTTVNLRHLVLHMGGSYCKVLQFSRFQLHTLSCHAFTDHHLITFLRQQTELKELVLAHSLPPIPKGRSHPWKFQQLESFDGPWTWAESILPKTPLLSRLMVTSAPSRPCNLKVLADAPIRQLRIPFPAVVPQGTADQIRQLIPRLDSLAILLDTGFMSLLKTNPIPALEQWLITTLSAVTTIRCLAIYGFRTSDRQTSNTINFIQNVTAEAPRVLEVSIVYGPQMDVDAGATCVWKRVSGHDWDSTETSVEWA
ncbi:F-box domain-containing protein [Mycena indigotica]|uniref:F-box domain-containing protein n=1 Tax=Mycena indigotica TaxID=2126181 RepID=A0A8H6WD20_9AGAR|nr:F-box domain-containing protein [Mycena indigotica]KAF7312031.1 F-box domain-containing protein [Mycena indigotica]